MAWTVDCLDSSGPVLEGDSSPQHIRIIIISIVSSSIIIIIVVQVFQVGARPSTSMEFQATLASGAETRWCCTRSLPVLCTISLGSFWSRGYCM